jgi:hypothetical protein
MMSGRSKVSEYSSLKAKQKIGPRTVEGDKPGDSLPNSSPPRVGAHANEEGERAMTLKPIAMWAK